MLSPRRSRQQQKNPEKGVPPRGFVAQNYEEDGEWTILLPIVNF
jgi:hypothetical protein